MPQNKGNMMKKILGLIVLCATVIIFSGCSKNPKVITKSNGLKYSDDTLGTGREAKIGDLVSVKFQAWVIKDSTENPFKDWSKDSSKIKQSIGSTPKTGQPYKYLLKEDSFIHGSAEAIAGMKVGGTRTIIIPSELAYGKKGVGPIPPNSRLKAVITLVDDKDAIVADLWDVDPSKYKTTKDGLKYEIIKEGTGPQPDSGDVVTVSYSGYLAKDSTKFDSSVERDEPFTFKLGAHMVIKGWDEGIGLLKEGGKARFIIPPDLGYGTRPMRAIPPNSTLLFDVELVKVEKQK
jgi:FKBP-type peptidyl-prolyl cis-trans isomerase